MTKNTKLVLIRHIADVLTHGGDGSGNFDHAGRPGKVGGSAPQGSSGGSNWDVSGGGKFYSLKKGTITAIISETEDGRRKYYTISYSDTADGSVTWDSEDFDFGDVSMIDPEMTPYTKDEALRLAKEKANKKLDWMLENPPGPKKKKRTPRPKGPGISYSVYD